MKRPCSEEEFQAQYPDDRRDMVRKKTRSGAINPPPGGPAWTRRAATEQYPDDRRDAVRKQYEQYRQAGQIAFVTFHPSFSYEDFVEGIKPFKNERNDLYYEVADGIFKQICFNALYALYTTQQQRALSPTTPQKRNFDALYFEFTDYLKRMMREGSQEIIFETKTGKPLYLDDINENETLIFRTGQSQRTYRVTKQGLSKLYQRFESIDTITHINQDIPAVAGRVNASVYWAAFQRLKTLETVRNETYNYLLGSYRLSGQPLSKAQYQSMKRLLLNLDYRLLSEQDYRQAGNFVLIIDEINRGNIASIFGELITLLEDDKRAGQPEALQTILPYSREVFSVPSNVYLIGTMNTADRSVEALDIALRRRFSFRAILPQPDLLRADEESEPDALQAAEPKVAYSKSDSLDGIDLAALLRVINQRLVKLLGEDYQIGHGYLMPVRSAARPLAALEAVFYQKIVPLLQEFFFNDAEKIALVIGQDFYEKEPPVIDPRRFFAEAEVDEDTVAALAEPTGYHLRVLTGSAFKTAIIRIYER